MGWLRSVKREVTQRQGGKCSICGENLGKKFILHHVINRRDGGTDTAENGEARHTFCEEYAHRIHKEGNGDANHHLSGA